MLKLTVAKWANAFMISWAHIKEMVANASGRAESFTPAYLLSQQQMDGHITINPPMLLWGDNKLSLEHDLEKILPTVQARPHWGMRILCRMRWSSRYSGSDTSHRKTEPTTEVKFYNIQYSTKNSFNVRPWPLAKIQISLLTKVDVFIATVNDYTKITVKSFIFVGPNFRGFIKIGTFVGNGWLV